MKRYEKMTKEEIMQFFTCDCWDCPLHNKEANNLCSNDLVDATCDELKNNWLTSEIKTKSRWELCRTDEDFVKMLDAAEDFCKGNHCGSCILKEKCHGCTNGYIKAYCTEKVEAEE